MSQYKQKKRWLRLRGVFPNPGEWIESSSESFHWVDWGEVNVEVVCEYIIYCCYTFTQIGIIKVSETYGKIFREISMFWGSLKCWLKDWRPSETSWSFIESGTFLWVADMISGVYQVYHSIRSDGIPALILESPFYEVIFGNFSQDDPSRIPTSEERGSWGPHASR